MKWFFFLALLLITACSTTYNTMYRPIGSTETLWQIDVKHSYGTGDNIKVIINDSTVIEVSALVFAADVEKKGIYRGKEIKLHIVVKGGPTSVVWNYEALVYVDNELAGKFNL